MSSEAHLEAFVVRTFTNTNIQWQCRTLSTIKPARDTRIAQNTGTTLNVIQNSSVGIQIPERSHFLSWSICLRADFAYHALGRGIGVTQILAFFSPSSKYYFPVRPSFSSCWNEKQWFIGMTDSIPFIQNHFIVLQQPRGPCWVLRTCLADATAQHISASTRRALSSPVWVIIQVSPGFQTSQMH